MTDNIRGGYGIEYQQCVNRTISDRQRANIWDMMLDKWETMWTARKAHYLKTCDYLSYNELMED